MRELYDFMFDEKGDFVPISNGTKEIWHYYGECLSLRKRNFELTQKVQQLEEQNKALKIAGNKKANDLSNAFEVYEGSVTIKDIVEAWHKAKGEAE